jgi:hypothetical protein
MLSADRTRWFKRDARHWRRFLRRSTSISSPTHSSPIRILIMSGCERPGRSPGWKVRDPRLGAPHGIHSCVGQTVARLEGDIMLTALAERIEAIELAGPPVRRLNNTLRGLASLPQRVTRR